MSCSKVASPTEVKLQRSSTGKRSNGSSATMMRSSMRETTWSFEIAVDALLATQEADPAYAAVVVSGLTVAA